MNTQLAALLEEVLAEGWNAEQVALKTRNAALASWVKYLDKAKEKLPAWVAARCWIDERTYIQSSSQATAAAKFEGLSGRLAVDLTLGLGVDAAALAARFERVIGVEADPDRAEVARFNFSRLGLKNIEVVCAKAEDFLASNTLDVDLIYIDPSRVDAAGKKVYSLEQSAPNVLALLPYFKKQTIIKLSPLFDIAEAERLLGGAVEVVSFAGECKEVLVRLGEAPERRCTIISRDGSIRRLDFPINPPPPITHYPSPITHIHMVDVAIAKARVTEHYMAQYRASYRIEQGVVFSNEKLNNFAGQCFVVERAEEYKPKAIKRLLTEKKYEIHLGAAFPYSIHQITAQLSIKAGGEKRLFFALKEGKPHLFFVSLSK